MAPRRHPLTAAMVSALIKQLRQVFAEQEVATVYLGGGSPSHLPREDLLRLVGAIHGNLSESVEFSIEVNPDQVDKALLDGLIRLGVNRLSIGAQSFHDHELAWLTRTYDARQILATVAQAREVGFFNISLDLIYALPGATLDSWRENLQRAVDLDVAHVSAYSLTYEPGTQLYRQWQQGAVTAVSEQMDREMYDLTIDHLGQAGIEQYEISNFARSGFACRHNIRYWENRDYLGLGPSGASYIQGVRSSNMRGIGPYIEAVEAGQSVIAESVAVSEMDQFCETAVLMLRQRRGIDIGQFQSRFGVDPKQVFAQPLARYQDLKLLEVDEGRICLTRAALAVADSILCDFSAL